MDIAVRHTFTLNFDYPVPHAVMHLLLSPDNTNQQTVKHWHISAPRREQAASYRDAYGNLALCLSAAEVEKEIIIEIEGTISGLPGTGIVGMLEHDPIAMVFKRVTAATKAPVHLWNKFRNIDLSGPNRLEVLHELMGRVHELSDDGEPQEAMALAQTFIGAARALDIPARLIWGFYVPAGGSETVFHHWAEAFDANLGWIGFDPSVNECPTERHARVACGIDGTSCIAVRCHPSAEIAAGSSDDSDKNSIAGGMAQQQTQN